jgi:uncharacterized membrane protein YfcA
MEEMVLIGYFGALVIGLVLGLIGGGGSILTVPILAYLLSYDAVTASSYSLFVVGSTALVGALRNAQKGMVDFRTGTIFAIPAFIAVYLTRMFLVPILPDPLFHIGHLSITRDMGILVLFALVMLAAAFFMIKGRAGEEEVKKKELKYGLIVLEGLVVGVLTGIVGAGGGFLIIPALVLLAGLRMKVAVATSLFIIAIKSLIGFLGDISHMSIDWKFLLMFTSLAILGIFFGIYLNKFVQGARLKKAFGWFVLAMAGYMLVTEISKAI